MTNYTKASIGTSRWVDLMVVRSCRRAAIIVGRRNWPRNFNWPVNEQARHGVPERGGEGRERHRIETRLDGRRANPDALA